MASLGSLAGLAAVPATGGLRLSRMRGTNGVRSAHVRATHVAAGQGIPIETTARWSKRRRAGLARKAIVDRSAEAAEELDAMNAEKSEMGFEKSEVIDIDVMSVDSKTTRVDTTPIQKPVSVLATEAGLVVDAVSTATSSANGAQSSSKLRKSSSAGSTSKNASGAKYLSFRQTGGSGGLLGCDRDVRSAALPGVLQRLDKSNKYPVLFFAPEMKDLAKKIAAEDIAGSAVELGDIDWRKFPDGFPDLFVNDAYGVRDRHVAFLASFHSPEVIFEQISIIYSLPKMFVASFTLILPFFPTGTSERVEREGEIATAVTLARILSNIPPSRGGPCSTLIFDIHALQERFYFGDNILPCFESGIPLLLNRLAECEDADNIVIAYPDEGARKRFHVFFKGMEEVVCTKVRDGGKRLVKLKEGEPAGRHVVIVDDLVQSGGTLIECQKLLSKLGALKVSAYVTHGVFPGNSWKRFTASSGAGGQGFTKFFLTDSCPQTAKAVAGTEPFEILSLSRPIAEALHV